MILNEAFKNLELQPGNKEGVSFSKKVLMGKVLNTRIFRRFTVSKIVEKTWRLKAGVRVDKMEDNIFKFSFGSKEERDMNFKGKLWSLNGAHLILKEWEADKAIKEISFNTTTFTAQIHGLPPVFLHEDTALKIGERIGVVHKDTINKKCVLHNSFLRFKVDLDVRQPLPAGFFQERAEGDDLWI